MGGGRFLHAKCRGHLFCLLPKRFTLKVLGKLNEIKNNKIQKKEKTLFALQVVYLNIHTIFASIILYTEH